VEGRSPAKQLALWYDARDELVGRIVIYRTEMRQEALPSPAK
jgi:hypothetical protein